MTIPTRRLGSAGLTTSAVGLGCMGMSIAYGPIDGDEAPATLRRAVERGVTLFDTADVYGFGDNERLVGRVLAPIRDEVVVATKFGIVRDPDHDWSGPNPADGRPEYVREALDSSPPGRSTTSGSPKQPRTPSGGQRRSTR